MLFDVMDEINEHRRERCIESVHVSVCKEEETVNDQEGRKVSDHGRCPWCGMAWHWDAQDISVRRRGQKGKRNVQASDIELSSSVYRPRLLRMKPPVPVQTGILCTTSPGARSIALRSLYFVNISTASGPVLFGSGDGRVVVLNPA